MRISDWSSDVCSSDLIEIWPGGHEEGKYKLGKITASDISDGSDSAYLVRVQFDGYEPEGVAAVDEEILLWDHDSSVGAMSLIREALAVALLLPDPTSRGSEAGYGHAPQTISEGRSGG